MNKTDRRSLLKGITLGAGAFVLDPIFDAVASENKDIALPPKPVIPSVPANLKPHDTLFLTWQRDPTTTITVQWVGPTKDAPTTVRVSPILNSALSAIRWAAGKVWSEPVWSTSKVVTKPFGDTELKVHRCEFTNLTPNTEYLLQIGAGIQVYRFRTMPAKATDTFTWVSGGDCGTGPHAIGTNQIAAKQEPYFALIGGDLGYDNGSSAKTAITFLQNYSKYMIDPKGRLIPMITCIGNHEVRGGWQGKRSDATFYLPLFDGLFNETTYNTLDFGDYLSIVLLDTGHISAIGGAQTDWLDTTLAKRQGRPHLIVANHVPAYPSFRSSGISSVLSLPSPLDKKLGVLKPLVKVVSTGVDNRKYWCPLFEKYGVDAVLEHHDHTFKRTHPLTGGNIDKYGVSYLGDGSWGQLRPPSPPEKRPYLAVVGQAYHMTVHRLEGKQRFHVAMEESGKIADIFTTNGKRPQKRG